MDWDPCVCVYIRETEGPEPAVLCVLGYARGRRGQGDGETWGRQGHGTAGLAELSPVSDRSMVSAGPHD